MNTKHALIIDDNRTNVTVLETLLAKSGVTHTSVLDPRHLAEVLGEITDLDVVFLDLELPGLSGFTVLETFKAHERFHDVPVVAYTVHLSELNKAHHAGFHSFIPKPIDPQRFPGQLERILRGEAVWERM